MADERREHGSTLCSSHFCSFYWLLVCQNRPFCCGIWARSTKGLSSAQGISALSFKPCLIVGLASVFSESPVCAWFNICTHFAEVSIFLDEGSIFSLVSFLSLLQLAPSWWVLWKSRCFREQHSVQESLQWMKWVHKFCQCSSAVFSLFRPAYFRSSDRDCGKVRLQSLQYKVWWPVSNQTCQCCFWWQLLGYVVGKEKPLPGTLPGI